MTSVNGEDRSLQVATVGRRVAVAATCLVIGSIAAPVQAFFFTPAMGWLVVIIPFAVLAFVSVPLSAAGTLLGLAATIFRGGLRLGAIAGLIGALTLVLILPESIHTVRILLDAM